jgi:hypothetical protein
MIKEAKKELNSLAEKLFQIDEVGMSKDVFRIIATIKEDSQEEVAPQKKISTVKDIEEASKKFGNLFR